MRNDSKQGQRSVKQGTHYKAPSTTATGQGSTAQESLQWLPVTEISKGSVVVEIQQATLKSGRLVHSFSVSRRSLRPDGKASRHLRAEDLGDLDTVLDGVEAWLEAPTVSVATR